MSDKKEAFETDLGHVEVDIKKKTVTIDGKPLHEVTSETSLMELLARDLSIMRSIIQASRSNKANLKTWLPGIGNRQCHEVWRKSTEDDCLIYDNLSKQLNIMLVTLAKYEAKWRQRPTAETPSSTSGVEKSQPATDAPGYVKNPEILPGPTI